MQNHVERAGMCGSTNGIHHLGKVESVSQSSDDSWIEFWVHRLVHGQQLSLIPAEIS